jgi:hypothetical protein
MRVGGFRGTSSTLTPTLSLKGRGRVSLTPEWRGWGEGRFGMQSDPHPDLLLERERGRFPLPGVERVG